MNYLYEVLLVLCGLVGLLTCVMLVRNELVSNMRQKAIDIISKRNERVITAGQFDLASWSEYDNAGSYDAMMFDLRKWKFEHFFPELNLVSANSESPAK